jgi:hypothetical protein
MRKCAEISNNVQKYAECVKCVEVHIKFFVYAVVYEKDRKIISKKS